MADGRKHVLIVEDDTDAREALAAFLEGEGYRVLEAGHGEEALEMLRNGTGVGAILLDLMMPVMNGFAFRAEQMRDPRLAGIPVAVVTADVTATRPAAALGVEAVLTKPIDFERLLAFVGAYC